MGKWDSYKSYSRSGGITPRPSQESTPRKRQDAPTRAALGAERAQTAEEQRQRKLWETTIRSATKRPVSLSAGGDSSLRDRPARMLEATPEQIALKQKVGRLVQPLIDHAVEGTPLPDDLGEAAKDPELRSLLTQRVLAATVAIAEAGDRPDIEIIAAERIIAWADQATGENSAGRVA